MKTPTQDEVNKIATDFIKLKKKADKSRSKKIKKQFEDYKNYATNKLSHLVTVRANRYKKFSNYQDLMQDGFEALMSALKTYDPKKGCFTWWARKYIDTRISRSANAHSTIRFPIKKAKETQPYKTSSIPVLIDIAETPYEAIETTQIKDVVKRAIEQLPEDQKQIITLAFEFSDKPSTITNISKEMEISRPTCLKLLEEAKSNLRNHLSILISEV